MRWWEWRSSRSQNWRKQPKVPNNCNDLAHIVWDVFSIMFCNIYMIPMYTLQYQFSRMWSKRQRCRRIHGRFWGGPIDLRSCIKIPINFKTCTCKHFPFQKCHCMECTHQEASYELDDAAIEILSYWFGGSEYWKRTNKDPPNCTAFWDDLWVLCKTLTHGEGGVESGLQKKSSPKKWMIIFGIDKFKLKSEFRYSANFEVHLEKAVKGEYDHWMNNPHGCLALIVLLVSGCYSV